MKEKFFEIKLIIKNKYKNFIYLQGEDVCKNEKFLIETNKRKIIVTTNLFGNIDRKNSYYKIIFIKHIIYGHNVTTVYLSKNVGNK